MFYAMPPAAAAALLTTRATTHTRNPQLRFASAAFLDRTVSVNVSRYIVTLPKVLEWYKADFIATSAGGASGGGGGGEDGSRNGNISSRGRGSPCSLLEAVAAMLPPGGDKERKLAMLLQSSANVSVKYSSHNWTCQPFGGWD
jgi:hypothetical protein